MIVQERHEAIMRVLRKRPRISKEKLQEQVGVSRSTLRRDLIDLEHLGELVQQRGVVLHAEYFKGEPTFERRRATRVVEKQGIAAAAAALVGENATVYVDAGTTGLEVGRLLLKRPDLRIFTHSIRLVSLAATGEASVFCVGGEYRRVSDAVVGGLTASWLDHLHFDICFVAASGLDEIGASSTELSETTVKQHILKRSVRRVLIADSEKWNHPSSVRFAEWKQWTDFVSDSGLSPQAREFIAGTSIHLHIA